MSFPRYPAYKDSGVEWLGAVPSHWHVTALKREFSVTLGKMLQTDASSPEDVLGPYLRAANIQWSGVDASDIKSMWLSVRDVVQLRLLPGDLLISEGGDVGRSCLWQGELEECYFQNSVNRVRPINGGSSRFLYYWMSTIKDKGYVDVLCNKSTIAHFTAEKVAAVPVPIPPNSEQESISHFLDRETAKIDALVAEQEQLITLLEEKRQAVISHAVTKGLDPSVPIKDSGVEWLGEVPAHWEVIPLKRLVVESVAGPYGASLTKDMYSSEGFRVYGQQQVIADDFSIGDYFISEEKYEEMRRYTVYPDDVLVSVMGTIGKVAVVTSDTAPGIINPRLVRYRCGSRVQPRFLQRVLMSQKHQEHLLFEAKGTTMDGLNMQTLGRVPVPIPPLIEQAEILDSVVRKIGELDPLLAEAEAAVSLLKERRSALISAAVTGQIDVRDWNHTNEELHAI